MTFLAFRNTISFLERELGALPCGGLLGKRAWKESFVAASCLRRGVSRHATVLPHPCLSVARLLAFAAWLLLHVVAAWRTRDTVDMTA